MTDNWISEIELQGYLDGELDADQQQAVSDYLAEHPDQAARLESYRRHGQLLRRAYTPILEWPIPSEALMAAGGARRHRSSWLVVTGAVAAAITLLAAGAASGWWLSRWSPAVPAVRLVTDALDTRPAHDRLVADALYAHRVYAIEARHPVEVGVDEKDHLLAWLSRRLDLPIAAPDLTVLGYQLVGGRLLPAASGPAAQLMYQDADGRRITLYCRGAEAPAEVGFRLVSAGDLAGLQWEDGRTAWALLGDLPRAEILRLSEVVYPALSVKSGHIALAKALGLLPPATEGERYAEPMTHSTMRLGLYAPRKFDPQKAHDQDELYFILEGTGTFLHNGERTPFEPGDAMFVAAGIEHRFEEFSDDFATWVVFYGPEGGEGGPLALQTGPTVFAESR